jgi:hypothetical protein
VRLLLAGDQDLVLPDGGHGGQPVILCRDQVAPAKQDVPDLGGHDHEQVAVGLDYGGGASLVPAGPARGLGLLYRKVAALARLKRRSTAAWIRASAPS